MYIYIIIYCFQFLTTTHNNRSLKGIRSAHVTTLDVTARPKPCNHEAPQGKCRLLAAGRCRRSTRWRPRASRSSSGTLRRPMPKATWEEILWRQARIKPNRCQEGNVRIARGTLQQLFQWVPRRDRLVVSRHNKFHKSAKLVQGRAIRLFMVPHLPRKTI